MSGPTLAAQAIVDPNATHWNVSVVTGTNTTVMFVSDDGKVEINWVNARKAARDEQFAGVEVWAIARALLVAHGEKP